MRKKIFAYSFILVLLLALPVHGAVPGEGDSEGKAVYAYNQHNLYHAQESLP